MAKRRVSNSADFAFLELQGRKRSKLRRRGHAARGKVDNAALDPESRKALGGQKQGGGSYV